MSPNDQGLDAAVFEAESLIKLHDALVRQLRRVTREQFTVAWASTIGGDSPADLWDEYREHPTAALMGMYRGAREFRTAILRVACQPPEVRSE